MTVQECIDYLEQIEDKRQDVYVWNAYTDEYFHIREIFSDIHQRPIINLEY